MKNHASVCAAGFGDGTEDKMGCFGNIIWFICCGLALGLGWMLVGLLWCITIVGIPIGMQCFKIAGFVLMPFGKDIHYNGGTVSSLLNILWIIFGGAALALEALLIGALLCVTIIGIPFGMQCFKYARVALMPFGTEIY